MESEKYQADIGGLHLQSEKHERQRPQLFQGEYAQVLRASQDDQGCEMKEETEGPNGASREAEERREQREVSAYRLEQVIDEQGRSEIKLRSYAARCVAANSRSCRHASAWFAGAGNVTTRVSLIGTVCPASTT